MSSDLSGFAFFIWLIKIILIEQKRHPSAENFVGSSIGVIFSLWSFDLMYQPSLDSSCYL